MAIDVDKELIQRLQAYSEGRERMGHSIITAKRREDVAAVIAEVERLRAERRIMLIDFEHVVDERNGLLAQQADIAALHFETEGVHTHTVCAHRYCKDDSMDQHAWPCPTAVAAGLDGRGLA